MIKVYYVDGNGEAITDYEKAKESLENDYGSSHGHCESCQLPLVHISELTISRDNINVCMNNECSHNKHEV